MREAVRLANSIFSGYGFLILAMLIIFYFIMEMTHPLRKRVQNRWQRIIINIVMALPAFALLRLLFIPFMVWLAMQNQHWRLGLNYGYTIPAWLEGGIAFIVLDYFIYIWHVLTHKVPVLWRFHLVHHTDLDLDVSTAIRFHFGELLLSAVFRGASVILTGASPLTVLIYELVFEACTNFQHSNWKLPLKLEKWINVLIVTPRMHGIHHSIVVRQRNSNWGTIFSFWDRLHQTFSGSKPQQEVVIGEAPYQNENELTVWKLLIMPFRKIKNQ